jgi:hypothetical protein
METKVKQFLSRDGSKWEGGDHKERVKEVENVGCILNHV